MRCVQALTVVAGKLAKMHAAEWVHRDLKPGTQPLRRSRTRANNVRTAGLSCRARARREQSRTQNEPAYIVNACCAPLQRHVLVLSRLTQALASQDAARDSSHRGRELCSATAPHTYLQGTFCACRRCTRGHSSTLAARLRLVRLLYLIHEFGVVQLLSVRALSRCEVAVAPLPRKVQRCMQLEILACAHDCISFASAGWRARARSHT